ncbi:hypothetical protein FRB95_004093 [Tulasnella sp. JGI-2019a]|nr:hypothetical protein FRB95_004093 [Tulasnella sp. JGI-2019a]
MDPGFIEKAMLDGASTLSMSQSLLDVDELMEAKRSEQELLSLQTCHTTFEEKLHHHLSAKRSEHNTRLSISHLPTELLVKVFSFLLPARTCVDTLRTLSLVSKTWAAVLLHTPSLWTSVHSDHPSQFYLTSLTRSRGAPLHVTYTDEYTGEDNEEREEEHLLSYLDAIGMEIRRWQSAEIIVPCRRFENLLKGLQNAPAPLLEILDLDCSRTRGLCVVDLFRGIAGRLRHLSLKEVGVPWESKLLSQLRTLELISTDIAGPSTVQVMRILEACPDLVKLCLNFRQSNPGVTPLNGHPIHLPGLEGFDVDLHTETIQHILSYIRIPNCKAFAVSGKSGRGALFSASTEHLLHMFTKSIASADEVVIRTYPNEVFYSGVAAGLNPNTRGPIVPIAVGHKDNDGPEAVFNTLIWLLDHLHLQSTPLPVTLSIGNVSTPYPILPVLDRLSPSLTSLDLHVTGKFCKQIMAYVSLPTEVAGRLRWPLPNLKDLSFENCRNLKTADVVPWVRRRAGLESIPRRDHKKERELPVLLSQVTLSHGKTEATYGIIEDLLKLVDRCVIWRDKMYVSGDIVGDIQSSDDDD